jgi:hypothetical protein
MSDDELAEDSPNHRDCLRDRETAGEPIAAMALKLDATA